MHSYCENCEQSKKELVETRQKLLEFQNLAKKIIQTDLLIQKYAELEAEHNKLKQDLTKKQRDYDQLFEQHKTLNKETEHLKKQNNNLYDKQQEFETAKKELEEKLENFKNKEKPLNNEIKSLRDSNLELKNELNNHVRKNDTLNAHLKESNEKYEKLKHEFENFKLSAEKTTNKTSELASSTPLVKTKTLTSETSIIPTTKNKQIETKDKEVSFFFSDEEEKEEDEEESVEKDEKEESEQEQEQNETEDQSKNISISKLDLEDSKLDDFNTQEELNQNELEFSSASNSDSESDSFSDASSESSSRSLSSSKSAGSSTSSSSSASKSKSSDKISISKLDENTELFDLSETESELEVDEKLKLEKDEEEKKKLKKEQEEKEEKLRKERFEKERIEREEKEKQERELETKASQLIERVTKDLIDEFFTNTITQSITEINITEFIIEKLINEEIKKEFKSVANLAIKEEIEEIKLKEKQQKEEIKAKIELEIIEKIINDTVDSLIKECCERTLHQERTERNTKIYDDLLDELLPKLIEKELLNVIFEEMSFPTKMIEPRSSIHINSPPLPSQQPSKSKQVHQEPKSKRFKTEPEIPPVKTVVKDSQRKDHASTDDSHTSYKEIRNNIKELLADYFRTFNFKTGFTFEELDNLINKIAKANNTDVDKGKFFSNLLIIHFINNRYIPLDEKKINGYVNHEEKLFKEYQELIGKKSISFDPNESANIQRNLEQKKSKLDCILHVKITSEEEKYVYLIKKLQENSNYENLFDDVLFELKTILLSNDFNKLYNYRIARMICFICKSSKNTQFINSLIFDLISLNHLIMSSYYFTIIITLARIWPECLAFKEIETLQNPIMCVVMYIVKFSIMKYSTDLTSKYLLYTLETVCNWKFRFKTSLEIWDYFQTVLSVDTYDYDEDVFILTENSFKLVPIMFEYLQAFKLLCINEGWEWTINTFIKNLIQKSLEQHTETSTVSTDPELKIKSQRFLAFYLYLQAFILSYMCPKKDSVSKASDAIKSYSIILYKLMFQAPNLNTKETFIIECAILESLVYLAPYNPTESFLQIQMWLLKYKSLSSDRNFPLPDSLVHKIKYSYEFFKDKLPNHIVIAF